MDPGNMLGILCDRLCGACVQSYIIFSDEQNFGTDFGDLCLDLVKERGRLEDWVKAWEILDGDGGFHRKLKAEDWQYRYTVGVLARICGLFANLKNLNSTYGVQVVQVGAKESRTLRIVRPMKSLFKDMRKQLSFSDKSKSSVTHPPYTSTSSSPRRTRPSSLSLPERNNAIDATIIAHLENPTMIETKALPPGVSLTDEFTRISDAAVEFQKILPAYKKFQWAISDKEKFQKLIQQLTKYNDGLYQSLPPPNQLTIPMEPGPLPSARNKHYTVPFNSTTLFTGRCDILQEIRLHFSFPASPDVPRQQRRYVLFGMGGSGKTQIAVKFAEDYRDIFWAILWVDATSHETAEKSFRDIARIAEVDENVKAAQQWLTNLEEEWLLIIDNADDTALDISEYFPPGNRGNILVTSRNRDCWKYGPESHHEIREMKRDDAVALLLKSSKTQSNEEAVQWASRIVEELGFLALAIHQAGAYIANSCQIDQYLDMFKQHRKELLLCPSVQEVRSYKQTVYTTWEMSFRKVEKENPVAADILQVLAFLHHEGISEDIFQRANSSFPSWKQSELYTVTGLPERLMRILQLQDNGKSWDLYHFKSDIDMLLQYSLVRRKEKAYFVHPLVHSWTRDRLERQEHQLFLRMAVCLLSHSIPLGFETEDCTFRRQLLSHIDACRIHSAESSFDSETDLKQVFHMARGFGLVYSEMGRWNEAERTGVQAVETSETIFGEEHPNTLRSMLGLATTYWNMGHWGKAEKIQERVVKKRESKLGKEHPNTLVSSLKLALTYWSQGHWEKAEKIQEHAVETLKRTLGNEHSDTLIAMGNLASTYKSQGRWQEAENIEERLVGVRERILGKEHPDTMTSIADLASTYRQQGLWKEAAKMGERAVKARETHFGKEHPHTLICMGNLALTYKNLGRWNEAETIEEHVVMARERILGNEHPDTLLAVGNLALTYRNQGRWKDAEKLGERIVDARKRLFGDEHPDTLLAMGNLALTYKDQGRLEEARGIEERVVEVRERFFGKEHPDTLTSKNNLASTYLSQGRLEEAEAIDERVIEAQERILGKEHPHTLMSMANLTSTYMNQGRWQEAEKLGERVAEARELILGNEHPHTLTSMANLASTYRHQGRLEEAERIGEHVSEAREKILGKEHPDTLLAKENLALTYMSQDRWQEAEKIEEYLVAARKRILGEEHRHTLTSMANLASTYRNQDRLEESEKIEKRVVEASGRVFGKEHPNTLIAIANLATTYGKQGRLEEEKKIEERIVETCERILGKKHPHTLTALENLAETNRRLEEAREIEVRASEGRRL